MTPAHDDEGQDAEERQHHPARGAVVQERDRVDRDGAHAEQAEAGRGDQAREQPRRRAAAHTLERPLIDVDPHGEEGDEQAARDERAVEGEAREVVERAQSAEVRLPPVRIGGRRDGQRRAAGEHRHDDGRETPDREQRGGFGTQRREHRSGRGREGQRKRSHEAQTGLRVLAMRDLPSSSPGRTSPHVHRVGRIASPARRLAPSR